MDKPVDEETQALIDWAASQLTDEDRAERAQIQAEIRACLEHLENWRAERGMNKLAKAA